MSEHNRSYATPEEVAELRQNDLERLRLLQQVQELTEIINDAGLYLAGSPHSEDHQVAASIEQRLASVVMGK